MHLRLFYAMKTYLLTYLHRLVLDTEPPNLAGRIVDNLTHCKRFRADDIQTQIKWWVCFKVTRETTPRHELHRHSTQQDKNKVKRHRRRCPGML